MLPVDVGKGDDGRYDVDKASIVMVMAESYFRGQVQTKICSRWPGPRIRPASKPLTKMALIATIDRERTANDSK